MHAQRFPLAAVLLAAFAAAFAAPASSAVFRVDNPAPAANAGFGTGVAGQTRTATHFRVRPDEHGFSPCTASGERRVRRLFLTPESDADGWPWLGATLSLRSIRRLVGTNMLAWIVVEGDRLVPWQLADSTRFRGVRPALSERANEATPKDVPATLNSVRIAKRSRLYVDVGR